MARPPKGKPLTYRPIRLDDDVWKECQRLGKEHGTINEGLSAALDALRTQEAQGRWLSGSLEQDFKEFDERRETMRERMARGARAFKGPIPKPKDRK